MSKVFKYLTKLEENKFLPPKFSTVIMPLIPFLKAGMVKKLPLTYRMLM